MGLSSYFAVPTVQISLNDGDFVERENRDTIIKEKS